MNKAQRRVYFTQLWPAACRARGWAVRDEARRRETTRECMRAIGAGERDSTRELNEAQVTALFVYLRHLGRPDDLRASAEWADCQEDYVRHNRVRQGDYWRTRAGYAAGGKLEKRRFGGRAHGGFCGTTELAAEEADQYLLTMRRRAAARKGGRP